MHHLGAIAVAAALVAGLVGAGVHDPELIPFLDRETHFHPGPLPPLRPVTPLGQVREAISAAAGPLVEKYDATSEEAKEASRRAGCAVLVPVINDGRFPSGDEWKEIAVDAAREAAIDVPPGSPVWNALENVKLRAEDESTDVAGDPSPQKAMDLYNGLECTLLTS